MENDFYEDDEPIDDIVERFEQSEKGTTEVHLPPGCPLIEPAKTWAL